MTAPNGPILFNSSSGSDTAASGLGPDPAVSGTGASLNATTTVDLSADNPDLINVQAGDLLWVDASSGRQFSIIASSDNTAKTVTCDDAFAVTETGRNWGIGGKRLSCQGSLQAFADAKGGWTFELEDGYTENISSAPIEFSADPTVTDGPIKFGGPSSPTTRPSFDNNGHTITGGELFRFSGRGWHVENFDITCYGNTSGWSSIKSVNNRNLFQKLKFFMHSDGDIGTALALSSENKARYCVFDSRQFNNMKGGPHIKMSNKCIAEYNHIIGCDGVSSFGIAFDKNSSFQIVRHNIIERCADIGIKWNAGNQGQQSAYGNIIYNCGIGISFAVSNTNNLATFDISNNIVTHSAGWGLDMGTVTEEELKYHSMIIARNAFYSNTSGSISRAVFEDNNIDLTADPFVDAANGDFNINNDAGGGALLRSQAVEIPSI